MKIYEALSSAWVFSREESLENFRGTKAIVEPDTKDQVVKEVESINLYESPKLSLIILGPLGNPIRHNS